MSDLSKAVESVLPGVLNDLVRLVAIPSVSSLPKHETDVRASAELVAELVRETGCPDVQIVQSGGKPAVIARFPAPAGQPTVCLYAHHDVQPTGDLGLWTSEPFAAVRRGDRLFGRGTADDKGGIGVHLAVLRAFNGRPPVGVTLFIEGEEEIGSPSLGRIIEANKDALVADCYVIADAVNWQVGEPAFTTRLRGMASVSVEVSTLDHALHSGQFGGVVPDAMTAMIKLLATLHDERGNVSVAGIEPGEPFGLDYPETRIREEAGVLDGVSLIGDGTTADRMWTRPSITVTGIDATPVALASNTLAPKVSAVLSLRVAPGRDSRVEAEALKAHLETNAPWGAKVVARVREYGQPGVVPTGGRFYETAAVAFEEVYGQAPIEAGCGGSIPLVAEFQDAFPKATIMLTAVVDPDSRMHGIDESLHLDDFARACQAEAAFLAKLVQIQPR